MRLFLLTVEGKGLKEDDVEQPRTRGDGREGKNAQRQKAEEQEEEEGGGGEDDTREVKIILREFHLSTHCGVKRGERSESEESGPAFPPCVHSLLLTLLSRPLLFLFSR